MKYKNILVKKEACVWTITMNRPENLNACNLGMFSEIDQALGEVELEVKPHVGNNGSLATAVAAVYTLMERNGLALEWLEKAVSWGYAEYSWLANDPNFKTLHQDERFIRFMETLKKAWDENRMRYSLKDNF